MAELAVCTGSWVGRPNLTDSGGSRSSRSATRCSLGRLTASVPLRLRRTRTVYADSPTDPDQPRSTSDVPRHLPARRRARPRAREAGSPHTLWAQRQRDCPAAAASSASGYAGRLDLRSATLDEEIVPLDSTATRSAASARRARAHVRREGHAAHSSAKSLATHGIGDPWRAE